MHSEAYLVIDFRSVTFGYLGGCYECMFEGDGAKSIIEKGPASHFPVQGIGFLSWSDHRVFGHGASSGVKEL